ncbi:MAG: citramalate synthase, partial [Pelagibacteraceae bacterium]|nr:citramalate synthase [Pelagibacteraceae bacterium]
IAKNLDELGIDYIEGGWPGANPTDNDFFSRDLNFSTSKFTAFGMTRRPGRSADNDPGLNALVNSNANTICLVGKSSSYQVKSALGITEEENLLMLSDSFNYLKNKNKESIYDAEHFFDGFKNNKEYAIECLNASYNSGVRWIVLCDTNGGTLPNEISEIIDEVKKVIPSEKLGIHAHNDTENGVANALAAINTGVRHVQGTINGLGERCGNTNLISLIPSLVLKTNFNTNISKDKLKSLTKISNTLSDILNEPKPKNSPYVGENAFSHKGGLHASAVAKDPSTYEHINPDLVGNTRNVIISDQAGKANLLSQLDKLSIKIDNNELSQILELIKQKESEGFSYDVALASFELLVRRHIGQINEYFSLNKFRVTDERRWNAKGKLVTDSEATVHLEVKNEEKMTVGVGNGPVNAIDSALRQALINFYPTLNDLKLTDYKVMILSSDKGTGAITRVHIESTDDSKRHWTTVGVSSNIIDASYNAIYDSITYKLFNDLNN